MLPDSPAEPILESDCPDNSGTRDRCDWPRNSQLILAEMRRLNETIASEIRRLSDTINKVWDLVGSNRDKGVNELSVVRLMFESLIKDLRSDIAKIDEAAKEGSMKWKIFIGVLVIIGSAAASWVFSLLK